jgi:hypothetical protein
VPLENMLAAIETVQAQPAYRELAGGNGGPGSSGP